MKVHEIMKLRERRRRKDDDCCPKCGKPEGKCTCASGKCAKDDTKWVCTCGRLGEHTGIRMDDACDFLCRYHGLDTNRDGDRFTRKNSYWTLVEAGYGDEIHKVLSGEFLNPQVESFNLYEEDGVLKGVIAIDDDRTRNNHLLKAEVRDGHLRWTFFTPRREGVIPEAKALMEFKPYIRQLDKVIRDAWNLKKDEICDKLLPKKSGVLEEGAGSGSRGQSHAIKKDFIRSGLGEPSKEDTAYSNSSDGKFRLVSLGAENTAKDIRWLFTKEWLLRKKTDSVIDYSWDEKVRYWIYRLTELIPALRRFMDIYSHKYSDRETFRTDMKCMKDLLDSFESRLDRLSPSEEMKASGYEYAGNNHLNFSPEGKDKGWVRVLTGSGDRASSIFNDIIRYCIPECTGIFRDIEEEEKASGTAVVRVSNFPKDVIDDIGARIDIRIHWILYMDDSLLMEPGDDHEYVAPYDSADDFENNLLRMQVIDKLSGEALDYENLFERKLKDTIREAIAQMGDQDSWEKPEDEEDAGNAEDEGRSEYGTEQY